MLTTGAKLGPYEIQASLGAGGMGEVEPFWRRERDAQQRAGVARRNPEQREGSQC